MALSKTSLNIDTLTVESLFNKEQFYSTGLSYVPIVSSYLTFHKWTNQATGTLFVKQFYTYLNGDIFFSTISSIQLVNTNISSSLYLNTDILSSSVGSNASTTLVYNNIINSTFSNYYSSLYANSTTVGFYYTTISKSYSSIAPGVSTTVDTFYDRLFAPNASTFIQLGIEKYINRGELSTFSYNNNNPNPLLGGHFGSNINNRLPSFWRGQPSGYIGPGLSSISTSLNSDPIYIDINTVYPTMFDNILIGVNDSNIYLDTFRNNITDTIINANNYLDGGSSISTTYGDTYDSTINSTLFYASGLGPLFSTSYDQLYYNINTTTSPTLDGFSIKQYISTANSNLNIYQNASNFILYSTVSNPSLLLNSFRLMSTTIIRSVSTSLSSLNAVQHLPGFFRISTLFTSTVLNLSKPLNISTSYNGYLSLSNYEATIFSTYSTNLPIIIASNTFSLLSTINSQLSTFSTIIPVYTGNFFSVPTKYITAPGISSFQSNLSTNTRVTYLDYSDRISSILCTFSTALRVVYAAPGLSSLSSFVSDYTSTSVQYYRNVNNYVLTGFKLELQSINDIRSTVINQIDTNLSNYISAGYTAFYNLASTYTRVSTNSINGVTTQLNYISSQTTGNNRGYIYQIMNSTNALTPVFLDELTPFYGSTVYYNRLTVIPDYSTSLYTPGNLNFPTFRFRSTSFYLLNTNSIKSSTSSFTVSTLAIQTIPNSSFVLNMKGTLSLQSATSNVIPNIVLPNFEIYDNSPTVTLTSRAKQNIVIRPSTISFNMSNFTIKRLYDPIPFSYTGINTFTPGYSLDIAIGEARKPSGVTWVTASDKRVKENISDVSLADAVNKISSLRLVSYIWDEDYSKEHGLTNQRQLGFISQEVQEIFAESVTNSEEHGFTDFKSLDVDQLYKAKFIVTQYLLERVLFLEMRISKLLKS
jgi:hypothetical protein